jgi:hypothetical protein
MRSRFPLLVLHIIFAGKFLSKRVVSYEQPRNDLLKISVLSVKKLIMGRKSRGTLQMSDWSVMNISKKLYKYISYPILVEIIPHSSCSLHLGLIFV